MKKITAKEKFNTCKNLINDYRNLKDYSNKEEKQFLLNIKKAIRHYFSLDYIQQQFSHFNFEANSEFNDFETVENVAVSEYLDENICIVKILLKEKESDFPIKKYPQIYYVIANKRRRDVFFKVVKFERTDNGFECFIKKDGREYSYVEADGYFLINNKVLNYPTQSTVLYSDVIRDITKIEAKIKELKTKENFINKSLLMPKYYSEKANKQQCTQFLESKENQLVK